MRKFTLALFALIYFNMSYAMANVNCKCDTNRADDDTFENLQKAREEVNNQIEMLKEYNSKEVIDDFTNRVTPANTLKEICEILKEAKDLAKQKEKVFKEYIDSAKKFAENNSSKKDEICNKIKEVEEKIKSAQTKDAVNKEIPKLKSKLRAYGYKSGDIKKYTSYLDAFYYKNNNIFDSYNDDIFFNLKLGGDISDKSFLSSLTLGWAYKLKKANVKLGGFIQYDYQASHNISLGTSVVYDNFLGFARYRLAMYNKVVTHNVDVFGKYYYEFLFNKLKVAPTVSLYSTVSSRVNVNNVVSISPRIGFDLNLGTKLSYNLLKNLNMFTEPTITVSYNDQNLDGETKNRSYFGYDINFGVEYKEKGISVKPILRLTGDMLGNVSLNTNLGIGYKF